MSLNLPLHSKQQKQNHQPVVSFQVKVTQSSGNNEKENNEENNLLSSDSCKTRPYFLISRLCLLG